MPKIPMYNQQTDTPSGIINRPAPQPGMVGQTLQAIGQTGERIAGQQLGVEQDNADFRARRLADYDREQEKLRVLEAEEWADTTASGAELQRHEAYNTLKRTIQPGQDFAREWKTVSDSIDQQAKAGIPSGNTLFSNSLSKRLTSQSEKFAIDAVNYRDAARAANSEIQFDQKIDTKRKILMTMPAKTADAELDRMNEELNSDPSLANLDAVKANQKHVQAMQSNAGTVLDQFLQKPEDAQYLVDAIDGTGRSYFRRKATATRSAQPVKVASGKYDKQINAAAEANGLDPALLSSMIKRESNGNPSALSPKGAMGLTQIMPDTARELGVDPRDPNQAIEGGARYLAKQQQTFGSDAKALAAYNAGPGAVKKAIGKAAEAGSPESWLSYLPDETQKYVPAILSKMGAKTDGADNYEQVTEPVAQLSVTKYATPEQLRVYRDKAIGVVAQDARARVERNLSEVTASLDSERKAMADGIPYQNPATYDDLIRAGMKPAEATVKMALQEPWRKMGPIIGTMKNMTKEQRDATVEASNPANGEAGMDYDAKRDAYNAMVKANDTIDKQINEDPAGYAIKSNKTIQQAKADLDLLLSVRGVPPAAVQNALNHYADEVSAFQRAQGVQNPAMLPKSQVDQVKRAWYGQPEGAAKAADAMVSLSQAYGKHYPAVLRQLAEELPSEALWVGQLASDPQTEGTRTQMAAASKLWPKIADIPKKGGVEVAVDAAFSGYQNSLATTSPDGGAKKWAQLRDGAVKLAAYKVQQSGASPSDAAKQAFAELVGSQSEFFSTDRIVTTYENGGSLVGVNRRGMIRVPKAWEGQSPDQSPDDVIEGARIWMRDGLPKIGVTPDGRSERVYMVDVKEHAGWVTSPDDDGLALMLGSAPVRDRSGKPIRISWRDAADATKLPPGEVTAMDWTGQAIGSVIRAATSKFIAPPKAPEPARSAQTGPWR